MTIEGLVTYQGASDVATTVDRLLHVLRDRGIPLLAQIDHAAGAEAAGLAMRPAQVLIFGNAAAGTPLMVRCPTIAIDLPLRMLVREDERGATAISYNDPRWLAARHGLTGEEAILEKLAGLLAALAQACASAAGPGAAPPEKE